MKQFNGDMWKVNYDECEDGMGNISLLYSDELQNKIKKLEEIRK